MKLFFILLIKFKNVYIDAIHKDSDQKLVFTDYYYYYYTSTLPLVFVILSSSRHNKNTNTVLISVFHIVLKNKQFIRNILGRAYKAFYFLLNFL